MLVFRHLCTDDDDRKMRPSRVLSLQESVQAANPSASAPAPAARLNSLLLRDQYLKHAGDNVATC